MIIFLNTDGSATKVTPEHIYQGSSGVDNVTVIGPFASNVSVQVAFKLPDGFTTTPDLMAYAGADEGGANVWTYALSNTITALAGSASVSFIVTSLDLTQRTTYLVAFNIEESILPALPEEDDTNPWTTLTLYYQTQEGRLNTIEADGWVTSVRLATGAVTTAKIADGAVTTPKIADLNVTEGKLAESAVATSKIADGAVTAPKIATGAVIAEKIPDAEITKAKLAAFYTDEQATQNNNISVLQQAVGTTDISAIGATITAAIASMNEDIDSLQAGVVPRVIRGTLEDASPTTTPSEELIARMNALILAQTGRSTPDNTDAVLVFDNAEEDIGVSYLYYYWAAEAPSEFDGWYLAMISKTNAVTEVDSYALQLYATGQPLYNWGEADGEGLFHITIPASTHGLGANNRLNIKVRALTATGTDEYEDVNTYLVSGTGTVTLYTDTPFSGVAVISSDTGYNISTTDHTALSNRDVADQHPIGAITDLGTALAGKLATDGDSKDCTATFTEAETLANIATGETHATLFGKIKKAISSLFSHTASTANPHSVTKTQVGLDNVDNLKQVATTTDQDISGNKKFLDTVFADSIKGKNLFNINGDINTRYNGTIISLNSVSNNVLTSNINGSTSYSAGQFINVEIGKEYTLSFVGLSIGTGVGGGVFVYYRDSSDLIATKSFTSTSLNIVRSVSFTPTQSEILVAFATSGGTGAQFTDIMFNLGAIALPHTLYIGEFFPTYDKVIRTQTEFEELIASSDWLGAVSVAFKGQFTLSTANNSGIKIPVTVKQIHGYNNAKITITNFLYNATTAKGGLWYDNAPTTADYEIKGLTVDCTGDSSYGFRNCRNISNCIGTGTGASGAGYGFGYCTNILKCRGIGNGTAGNGFGSCTGISNCIGTGTGASGAGYGFGNCTGMSNCIGTGTGPTAGQGFFSCTGISNCRGKGTGSSFGYGFYNIIRASNCEDDGSTVAMWGGTNSGIDTSAYKTPAVVSNATLNA